MSHSGMSLLPETPYLKLLEDVLSQLHHSENHQAMKMAVWLIYRILDINQHAVYPFLALAYVFALIGEWNRAYQVMLFAQQEFPNHQGVDLALQHYLEHLTLVHTRKNESAVQVSFGVPSKAIISDGSIKSFADLPTLLDIKSAINANPTDLNKVAVRFKSLRPVLVSLAEEVKDSQSFEA